MATQSLPQVNKNKRTELDGILNVWENRYKLRLLSKWLPRAIILALILCISIAFVGYSQGILLAQQVAIITLAVCGISGLGAILYIQLFPRPRIHAARYFDLQFGLKERVSTAFELLDGRIQTYPEIETLQISDAVTLASAINAKQDIEMDWRHSEIIVMMVLMIIICVMIALPIILGQDTRPTRPSQAVQAAQEDVRDMIESIATDADLEEIDRQQLLEALEIALDRLEDENVSDEEAFAAMSQLQSELSEKSDELSEQMQAEQSALEDASENFAEVPGTSSTSQEATSETGDPSAEIPDTPSLSEMLENLQENASELTTEQQQQLAEALQAASQSLSESNPQLAKSLADAAQALMEADPELAKQLMQQAQQQAQDMQEQQQQNGDAQQSVQEASDQAQQAAQEISEQAQQEQQQSNGEGENGESDDSNSQGSGQQQSEQSSDQAAQGNNPSNQSSSVDRPSNAESENEGGNSNGDGAGDSQASNTSSNVGGGEDRGVDNNNNATGDGEIEYEAIYNPQGIQGGGQDEMQLETDSGNAPLTEGNFEDNPSGESQVSYDTVFSDYQNAANRALESDYVPLGLRDVVRDYFTSLEPADSGS